MINRGQRAGTRSGKSAFLDVVALGLESSATTTHAPAEQGEISRGFNAIVSGPIQPNPTLGVGDFAGVQQ
jgi:hypothetical protein